MSFNYSNLERIFTRSFYGPIILDQVWGCIIFTNITGNVSSLLDPILFFLRGGWEPPFWGKNLHFGE